MSKTSTSRQRNTANKKPMPAPFASARTTLTPVINLLDTQKVYIFHLDQFPWHFKRKIFAVPVLLNVTIALLLAWRAWNAGPTYVGMFSTLSSVFIGGQRQPWSMSWVGLLFLVLKRMVMVLVDSILVRVISPWPITFFFEGPANPCTWRWNVGFQDTEVVVRVSRGWGTDDLVGKDKAKRGQESPFWKTRVLPAVQQELLKGKTGYALMGKDWDLEFRLMTAVTKMVEERKLGWADLKTVVLAWDEGNGWMVWRVGEQEENDKARSSMTTNSVEEDEARKIMERFKDRLFAMGKEDLFYRWVELMQYETDQGSGFTVERQVAAVTRVRELFEQHGVDYADFLSTVEGLPPGIAA